VTDPAGLATNPGDEQFALAQRAIAELEAAMAELGAAEQGDAIPLGELATRLADLHTGLQNALGELDRA